MLIQVFMFLIKALTFLHSVQYETLCVLAVTTLKSNIKTAMIQNGCIHLFFGHLLHMNWAEHCEVFTKSVLPHWSVAVYKMPTWCLCMTAGGKTCSEPLSMSRLRSTRRKTKWGNYLCYTTVQLLNYQSVIISGIHTLNGVNFIYIQVLP